MVRRQRSGIESSSNRRINRRHFGCSRLVKLLLSVVRRYSYHVLRACYGRRDRQELSAYRLIPANKSELFRGAECDRITI